MDSDPLCLCGHSQSLHTDRKGICWGDPYDVDVTMCKCAAFIEDPDDRAVRYA